MEATPAEYVEALVAVFREVRRVLRDDGTLWLNLGDSYANDGKWGGYTGGKHATKLHGQTGIGRSKRMTGLKPKDLCGMPWRVAFALQADGWYLRSDIIWHKLNPMPESITDRPTKAHEYVFLMAKSERYFYDAAAIAEPAVTTGRVLDYTGAQKNNTASQNLQRTLPRGRVITIAETMLTNLNKTPWWWFGAKADAAPAVWAALGDVDHYVEPFAGSLAVLLRRPHPANRTYYSETVNDLDALLCNAWRAMVHAPDEMAEAASWPVCEADLTARHLALVRWRESGGGERLAADPNFYDAKMAGWWAWGQSSWIGSGWCSGDGPWHVGADGRIVKQARGTREPGVDRKRPHLGNNGQGVNRPQTREPGVESEHEYHPMTMPELRPWFAFLSARLRHVRVLNGDWTRALTSAASKTLPVRNGKGVCGVFLDPPYGDVRADGLYAVDSLTVAADVQAWCREHGDDPEYRIVLAGFDTEHEALESLGWTAVEWFRAGWLKGGMGNTGNGVASHQQHRERLWLSPHCLRPEPEARQGSLW